MQIDKEWWKKAEKYGQETTTESEHETATLYKAAMAAAKVDYEAGAQAYANSVERLLKDRANTLTRHIELTDSPDVKAQLLTTSNEINLLLFELQTLKP